MKDGKTGQPRSFENETLDTHRGTQKLKGSVSFPNSAVNLYMYVQLCVLV